MTTHGCLDKISRRYDISLLEKAIREAIIRFEPRIDSEKLVVEIIKVTKNSGSKSAYGVIIKGLLNVAPVSEELLIKSEIDIDNGTIKDSKEGFDG